MKVLTKNGFKSFSGIKKSYQDQKIWLTFSDNSELGCTEDHKLLLASGSWITADKLQINTELLDGNIYLVSKVYYKDSEPVYDLLDVADGNHYITNSVTSHNCVYLDEVAFINDFDTFFKSTYPTISSGKSSKMIMISTPNGMNHYATLWHDAVAGRSEFVPIEVNWWDHPDRDETWKETQIKNTSVEAFNQEYGNQFLGSSNTLIEGYALKRMMDDIKDPVQSTQEFRIYEEPDPKKKYIMSVDVADVGSDASSISVIDITNFPYEQVACYSSTKISAMALPQIIMNFGTKYNNAEVLIENNDAGKVVLYILNYQFEYENIISTRVHTTGKIGLGLRTSSRTKSLGCARIKDLIERRHIIIRDKKTLDEFNNFVLRGNSYEAEQGFTDDMVMGLVNLGYYIGSTSYDKTHDVNYAEKYTDDIKDEIYESLSPIGIFSSTLDDTEDTSWLLH